MNFGARTSESEARRIIDRALEAGVDFVDTANVYADGASERIVGATVRARREKVRIATKVGLLRRDGAPEGLAAARIVAALDESLERLGTDHVDVYYLHAPDPRTPLAETLDGVQSVLASGKARAWGVSNFASWQLLELQLECDRRGMPRPAVSQVIYNLLVRQLDVEYFAFARRHGPHTTVYNPLAGGLLARSAGSGARLRSNPMYQRRYGSAAFAELVARYEALATEHDLDLVTFAYAWLLGHPDVGSVLVGPGSVAHLDSALAAREVKLPDTARAAADLLHRDFVGSDATYAR